LSKAPITPIPVDDIVYSYGAADVETKQAITLLLNKPHAFIVQVMTDDGPIGQDSVGLMYGTGVNIHVLLQLLVAGLVEEYGLSFLRNLIRRLWKIAAPKDDFAKQLMQLVELWADIS
jgi:hypothetical protein